MARKNLFNSAILSGEINTDIKDDRRLPADKDTPLMPTKRLKLGGFGGKQPRGALGAVSESFNDLRSRATIALQPEEIDDSPIVDRLTLIRSGPDPEWDEFVSSLDQSGQRIPILVRPHPDDGAREQTPYQIVYGRRRLKALRQLGKQVIALVKEMDDREAVLVQGQENTARADLTYIEKATFAFRLEKAGHDRETIMSALTADKFAVSRMIAVVQKLPIELIEAIGPARKTGRDRWTALAGLIEKPAAKDAALAAVKLDAFAAAESDERFAIVFDRAEKLPSVPVRAPAPVRQEINITDPAGKSFARVVANKKTLTLVIDRKESRGFEDWLIENINQLRQDWLAAGNKDEPAVSK